MVKDTSKALELAGKMATQVRYLVGGTEISMGARIRPMNVMELTPHLENLKKILDAYDEEILKLAK